MSNPNAIRITDLNESDNTDLENADLLEVVDKNGDPNGNPASRSVSLDNLSKFLSLLAGLSKFNIASFEVDDLDDNDAVKINENGDVDRNSGFVILQTEIQVSSTSFNGELAVFLWSHNSNNAQDASVSLFTSTDSIFEASTSALVGTTGNDNKITFSVGTSNDNEPPMWIENRIGDRINFRLNTF